MNKFLKKKLLGFLALGFSGIDVAGFPKTKWPSLTLPQSRCLFGILVCHHVYVLAPEFLSVLWALSEGLPSVCIYLNCEPLCMTKIFMGGGVVDGEGVAVKDAWSGVVGVIKGSFQKHLKKGVGKSKSCLKGGGGLKMSPLLPPPPPRKF